MVSGGTAGGVQQQQGNASRASTTGRYPIPISPLVNNYFNYWLNYIFWCLLMRQKKRREKGNGKLDLNYGSFRMKWTIMMNYMDDRSLNLISPSQIHEANDVSQVS